VSLLAFCLILTVVSPTNALYHVAKVVPKLASAGSPNRILLLGVYCVLFTLLAAFSFTAGTNLWLVRKGAVTMARRYLLTHLIANFAYFGFWVLLMRPHTQLAFAQMGWYHVVGPIGAFALFLYLEHSKRVRETYPLG
jgi:uncharacterized membrane protein YozB (DUF420 family)